MSEITLHTGCMSEFQVINIDWFDHNNIKRSERLEIKIRSFDKPRTLRILLNNVIIAEIPSE